MRRGLGDITGTILKEQSVEELRLVLERYIGIGLHLALINAFLDRLEPKFMQVVALQQSI